MVSRVGVSLVVISCNDLHRKIPIANWSLESRGDHSKENETIQVETKYLYIRDMFIKKNQQGLSIFLKIEKIFHGSYSALVRHVKSRMDYLEIFTWRGLSACSRVEIEL